MWMEWRVQRRRAPLSCGKECGAGEGRYTRKLSVCVGRKTRGVPVEGVLGVWKASKECPVLFQSLGCLLGTHRAGLVSIEALGYQKVLKRFKRSSASKCFKRSPVSRLFEKRNGSLASIQASPYKSGI